MMWVSFAKEGRNLQKGKIVTENYNTWKCANTEKGPMNKSP